jgi:hypothetical protein
MAYLNRQEREALLNELKDMKFNQAKGKLRRLDPKGRLAFIRNAQASGELHTRYELEGMGTRVTLVEEGEVSGSGSTNLTPKFKLVEIIVEPTPDNRT